MNKRAAILIAATLCLTVGLLTSCLKDSPCHFGMDVTVYIENNYQNVEPVALYILNMDGTFREKLTASLSSESNSATFSLNHLPNGNYKLVVWGNEKETLAMPPCVPGQSMLNASINLMERDEYVCHIPSELFYGYKEITRDESKYSQEKMTLSRNIAGVIVTVTGAANDPEILDTYDIILRGTLYSIPFINEVDANTIKSYSARDEKNVLHHMPLDWDKESLSSRLQYVFPSDSSRQLMVSLYQNGNLIKEYMPEVTVQMNKIIEIKLNIGTAGDWFQVVDWYTIGQDEEV